MSMLSLFFKPVISPYVCCFEHSTLHFSEMLSLCSHTIQCTVARATFLHVCNKLIIIIGYLGQTAFYITSALQTHCLQTNASELKKYVQPDVG